MSRLVQFAKNSLNRPRAISTLSRGKENTRHPSTGTETKPKERKTKKEPRKGERRKRVTVSEILRETSCEELNEEFVLGGWSRLWHDFPAEKLRKCARPCDAALPRRLIFGRLNRAAPGTAWPVESASKICECVRNAARCPVCPSSLTYAHRCARRIRSGERNTRDSSRATY